MSCVLHSLLKELSGRVVQECRDLLASLRNNYVCFRFVKRSANKVAHFLARNHCSGADRIWNRIWRVGDVDSEFIHVMLDNLRF